MKEMVDERDGGWWMEDNWIEMEDQMDGGKG